MTTKTEASDKTHRPSSTDRFRALGATRTSSLPVFSSGELLTVADEGHPCYKPGPMPWRYRRENPKMAGLMESIRLRGITKGPTAGQIKGQDPNTAYVKTGNRTTWAIRYLVMEGAVGPDGKPIPDEIPAKVNMSESLSTFIDGYRADNRWQEGDDPITIAYQMADALAGNDAEGVAPLGIEQVAEQFDCSESYVALVTDPQFGLLALSDECKDAVSRGEISEKIGLAIAQASNRYHDPNEIEGRHAFMDDILTAIGERDAKNEKTSTKDIEYWLKTGNIGAKKRNQKREDAPIPFKKVRKLYDEVKNDKSFADMSALDLLAVLCNEQTDHQMADSLRLILAEASKPGRKVTKKDAE